MQKHICTHTTCRQSRGCWLHTPFTSAPHFFCLPQLVSEGVLFLLSRAAKLQNPEGTQQGRASCPVNFLWLWSLESCTLCPIQRLGLEAGRLFGIQGQPWRRRSTWAGGWILHHEKEWKGLGLFQEAASFCRNITGLHVRRMGSRAGGGGVGGSSEEGRRAVVSHTETQEYVQSRSCRRKTQRWTNTQTEAQRHWLMPHQSLRPPQGHPLTLPP